MPIGLAGESRLHAAATAVVVYLGIAWYSAVAFARGLSGVSAEALHTTYVRFARFGIGVGRTRVEVHGREHIEPGRSYVVVTNHESNLDPVCILAGLPELVIRFVVKRELMLIPLFGQALRATGNVEVFRRQAGGDVDRIQQLMDRRDPRVSILFFAEGTRDLQGALRPFKMGAFATAIGYGIPILPVGIGGTYAVIPRGSFHVRPRTVAIEVGAPIATDGLTHEDRASLRDEAHEAVTKLRASARQHVRSLGCEPGGID